MLAILWPLVSWIFRGVVVKFVILTAVYAVLAVVVPMAIDLVASQIGVTSLNTAFSNLDGDTWFFLDFFALDVGIPAVISALVARFLVRRLPFVG
jgi:hypothetical protein